MKDTPVLAAAGILAGAQLYITGRYHPALMASAGGVPCVFMTSNSHKTKSLQELLGYDNPFEFSVFPDNNEILKIVLCVKEIITNRSYFSERLLKKCNELNEKSLIYAKLL